MKRSKLAFLALLTAFCLLAGCQSLPAVAEEPAALSAARG